MIRSVLASAVTVLVLTGAGPVAAQQSRVAGLRAKLYNAAPVKWAFSRPVKLQSARVAAQHPLVQQNRYSVKSVQLVQMRSSAALKRYSGTASVWVKSTQPAPGGGIPMPFPTEISLPYVFTGPRQTVGNLVKSLVAPRKVPVTVTFDHPVYAQAR